MSPRKNQRVHEDVIVIPIHWRILNAIYEKTKLPGFIAVVLAWYFIFVCDTPRRHEIIDIIFLLKGPTNTYYCSMVITGIVIILIVTLIGFYERIRAVKSEMRRVVQVRDKLFSQLTNRKFKKTGLIS